MGKTWTIQFILYEGLSLCNQKGSVTHRHGLAVYLKEVLSFAWELSLENSANSYLCFQLALLDSASYFFFCIRSLSLSL